MSTQADTITKLSYLLPTGTFLTFQVLAPLTTNNGHCGRTEQILTTIALALLVSGCIFTSLTDSYTLDGELHTGVPTSKGLWVLGHGTIKLPKQAHGNDSIDGDTDKFKQLGTEDFVSALLSAVAFLTLTMFTDPVSSCFYPHLSETVLKTLPVLLATVLSFCSPFLTKIRHGYGNSATRTLPAQATDSSKSNVDVATKPMVTAV